MKTVDFSYFIERFNAGEMTEAEKQWFRKELEGNYMLREEVDLRSKTDKVLNDQAAFLLRNKLRHIERQRAETVPARHGKNSVMKYAALIALLVVVGSALLLNNRNYSNSEILERFNKPYEGISSSRSMESTTSSDYTTAVEYYNIHDYSNAARFFTKVLSENPQDMDAAMLYGVSNFEQKNYPVAKQSFTMVVGNNENLYIEDAQWYLALCYIQTNEKERAVEQLAMIRNSESLYKKDARKLLRRIK